MVKPYTAFPYSNWSHDLPEEKQNEVRRKAINFLRNQFQLYEKRLSFAYKASCSITKGNSHGAEEITPGDIVSFYVNSQEAIGLIFAMSTIHYSTEECSTF